jgi:AcrR family transcriptional regulator
VHYTAVYRYFPGKDDLLEAALTHMLEESGVTVPESGTPRERILGLLRGLRAAFARHPGMALPNLTAQDEQATAEFVRGALHLLEEMGLSGRDLVVAYQMLENFHVGVTAYDFADYPDGLEKRMRGRRLVGHPAMDEVSRSLDDMQAVSDEAFEATANALLDACEAMAARTKRP